VFPREEAAEEPPVPILEEDVPEVEEEPHHESMPTPTQSLTTLASDAPSDAGSTQPTTPSSAVPPSDDKTQRTPTQPKAHRATKSVVPAVPMLPQSPNATRRTHRDSVVSTTSKMSASAAATVDDQIPPPSTSSTSEDATATSDAISSSGVPIVSPTVAPKSWADLVRTKALASAPVQAAVQMHNGLGGAKVENLSDVLNDISVTESDSASRITLLEPRGLVNTGNMCYMNSVSLAISSILTFG